jgi:hypothetical protein
VLLHWPNGFSGASLRRRSVGAVPGTVLVRSGRLTSIGLQEADNSPAICCATCLTSGSSPDRLRMYVPQVITKGTFTVSCVREPDKAVRLVSL